MARISALLATALLAAAAPRLQPANLVANGNFAQVSAGKPVSWEAAGDPRSVTQTLSAASDGGRSCARLTCTRIEGEGGASHAMLAQVGIVRLEQGRLYEFSCSARQEGIKGRSVSVSISDTSVWAPCGLERSLAVESVWRTYRVVFRATRSVGEKSRLQFWYTEPGTLYLADVRISEAAEQRSEFTEVVAPGNGPNLVPNGSFELGGAGWSSAGITTGWGDLARLHGAVVDGREPGRSHILRVPLGDGRTPVLGFDYYEPVLRPQTRALAANLRWIAVEPGAAYTLSADMRASEDGVRGALAYLALDPDGSRWNTRRDERVVTLSRQWKRFAFTFRSPKRYLFVMAGPDLVADRRVDVDIDNVMLVKADAERAYGPWSSISVAVEPSSPTGAWAAGERALLTVRVASALNAARAVTVKLGGSDYFGKPVVVRPETLRVPPNGTASASIPVPSDWRGWYGLRVTASTGSGDTVGVVTPNVRLSIVPRPVHRETVLGLNHAFPDPALFAPARLAGVSQYRDWSLKWEHIEPHPGEWRWDVADGQIRRVLDGGASLMALLPPFPSAEWSSTAPKELRTPGYPGERLRQAWAPADPGLLAAFAERAVARYRDRIHVWEFLNEPIYTDYALPRARYQPQDYVRLLKPVAAAIRRSDPKARVMGGAGAGASGVTQEMIDEGLLDEIDILNIHIYPGARAPEGYIAEMDRLLHEMDRRGKRRPIWVTEFSYYGADNLPRRPFMPDEGDWSEQRLLASERECAEYTVRFCAVMLSHGCERVFIHSGSSGSVNMPSFECCLFDYGGAPRKAASALGVMASLLGPNPKTVPVRVNLPSAHAAAFETGTSSVAMVWSTEPGHRISAPAGARCLDLMGRALDGRSVALSGAPIYIVGPSGRAGSLVRPEAGAERARP